MGSCSSRAGMVTIPIRGRSSSSKPVKSNLSMMGASVTKLTPTPLTPSDGWYFPGSDWTTDPLSLNRTRTSRVPSHASASPEISTESTTSAGKASAISSAIFDSRGEKEGSWFAKAIPGPQRIWLEDRSLTLHHFTHENSMGPVNHGICIYPWTSNKVPTNTIGAPKEDFRIVLEVCRNEGPNGGPMGMWAHGKCHAFLHNRVHLTFKVKIHRKWNLPLKHIWFCLRIIYP